MRYLLFLFVLFGMTASKPAIAQSGKGQLTGRVTDPDGAVVRDASVQLLPSGLTTVTDHIGEFLFTGVAPGKYTVKVLSSGFADATLPVEMKGAQAVHLEVKMKVSNATESVEVDAQSGQSEIGAINEQLNATNIVAVQSAEEIASLPNQNVSDAVGRMAGVTLFRNAGEGEYIQVRGMAARFTNVTIDGVTLPAPEATVRQIDLATIPADMIQSIQLNKTLSANMDADGIGGSVNLVTRTAGYRPFYSAEARAGYMPILGGRYVGQVDGVAGRRFLNDKRLGLVVGYSYDYNGRGYNDIEPLPLYNPVANVNPALPFYSRIELRDYRLDRTRWGTTVGGDYKYSDRTTFGAHFVYANFKDWGDRYYYRIPTAQSDFNQANINAGDVSSGKFEDQSRRPEYGIGSLSLTGRHQFDTWWINGGTAVSRARLEDAGGTPNVQFKPTTALKNALKNGCTFDPTMQKDAYRPQWAENCMEPSAAVPVYDPTQYTWNNITTTSGKTAQLNLQDWVSTGHTYQIGKNAALFEMGGEFRNAHKFQNAYTPYYAAPAGLPMANFLSGFTDKDYYSGSYHAGPYTNYTDLINYFTANQAQFTLNVDTTHFQSDPDNFDLIERREALYFMNTIEFPKLRIQTGIRFEDTQSHGRGYQVNLNGSAYSSTTPLYSNLYYVDPLPSVMARYAITDNTDVRATYARGISQPNLTDLVPFVLINSGSSVPTVTIGNPDIQPTHANNYDLVAEHRLLRGLGVIGVGYFYKQLSDPIVTTISPTTAIQQIIFGNIGSGTTVGQDINAGAAHVTGLEFAWRQRFTMLPRKLRGLGLGANYTYTNSNVEGIPGRTDHPIFDGQAKHAFNIQPTFDNRYISLHMGFTYNDRNIQFYQYYVTPGQPALSSQGPINGPSGDDYFYPHLQVDAQAVYRITHNLMFIVDGLNLTNAAFGSYYGSPQYVAQREYYRWQATGSLRWTSSSR